MARYYARLHEVRRADGVWAEDDVEPRTIDGLGFQRDEFGASFVEADDAPDALREIEAAIRETWDGGRDPSRGVSIRLYDEDDGVVGEHVVTLG
jgi:hypothetical protein